jgi:hypothetical protein
MSLDIMGNMLDMRRSPAFQGRQTTADAHDTYAGNSFTNLILRKNGYKSHFLLNNYYVGINALSNRRFFDEMYPPRDHKVIDLDFLVILLRGIFQGEMNFDTKGWIDNENSLLNQIQNRKHELIRDSQKPKFVVNHLFLPGHSQNSGICMPDETENWVVNLTLALSQMEADFATSQKTIRSNCDRNRGMGHPLPAIATDWQAGQKVRSPLTISGTESEQWWQFAGQTRTKLPDPMPR